jgi:uncharacterized protein YdeI (YjbR/CyaY-like superfamily)
MTTPTAKNTKAFKTSKSLNTWLRNNHDKKDQLFVKIYKKGSGISSVTWNDVVIEVLCWGWIDGVKKSFDEHAYLQRITPRKSKSLWSKINTRHVERLIEQGRMQEPGLVHVRAAQQDGRWENAYAPPSEIVFPSDFEEALIPHPSAQQFFNSLSKSSRNVIAYGLTTAKKSETRQRRFDKFLDMMIREETPDFGFSKKKS